MYLLDIIPLAKIPHTLPQILSYFSGQAKLGQSPAQRGNQTLSIGALVQIPLGRRKEKGIIIGARDIADSKMEIKSANFELRNVNKIISLEPVLTKQQIELALFLGQYYFCSPGIFAKMSLPPKNTPACHTDPAVAGEGSRANARPKFQTLILTPTISRAHSSYESSSSDNSVLWHSELTQKQKNATWLAVKIGQAQTIIGTRSAVFLPFTNLKKIIIEDKTNPNHKSWDMFPHYDSRLIAQKLAKILKSKITFSDKSHALRLREIIPVIIDMREELKGGNFSIFSVDLYEAVKNALTANQQIILFINRRGLANFILCRDCGYVAKCQNCDAPLAHHLINSRPALLCHHCGTKEISPKTCPKCKSWRIKTVGSGSQKVEAETKKFFPDAKILRLDSDSAPKPKDQQKIIADFVAKKADILIATQTIFSWLAELSAAKPQVIGLLSADTLLHIPDFRSGERTFQTIRALQSLRNNAPRPIKGVRHSGFKVPDTLTVSAPLTQRGVGGFFIQTYNPNNSVLKYIRNNDYEGFIKEDMATRQALNYPPFSQIVKLTFRHRDANKAGQEAKILAEKLKNIISNPSPQSIIPAPHQVRGKLRWESETYSSLSVKGGWEGFNPGPGFRVHRSGRPGKPDMTTDGHTNTVELSPALPAFLPREKGKFVWNIIIKFKIENLKLKIGNEFLQHRNSLLQYVPQNWEIDVDPENLL